MSFAEKIEGEIRKIKEEEKAAIEAARAKVPPEYHDHLVFLTENKVICNREVKISHPDVYVWNGKTYVKIERPYLTVAGRVAMFVDEHRKAGAKFTIATESREKTASFPPYVKVTVESEIYGTADGCAEIKVGGKGADMTHPIENAETSALGRALAKLGFGVVGGGLASAEEVLEAKRLSSVEAQTKEEAPAAAPAKEEAPAPASALAEASPAAAAEALSVKEEAPAPTPEEVHPEQEEEFFLTILGGPYAFEGKQGQLSLYQTNTKGLYLLTLPQVTLEKGESYIVQGKTRQASGKTYVFAVDIVPADLPGGIDIDD